MHDVKELIEIFNDLFVDSENTELVSGDSEPMYLPANNEYSLNRIVFAHGFFSSALHEVAHWCIAGEERRKLVDYGYWYNPDGRTIDQQEAFAAVEAKPQALEWILSQGCLLKFVVSLDNLSAIESGEIDDFIYFKQSILKEIDAYKRSDIPARAILLYKALAQHFNADTHWFENSFFLEQL